VPPGDPFPWRNQVTLTDCTFTSNKAAYGGAIFVDQQARTPCCSLWPGLYVVAPEAEDPIATCCLAQATSAVCLQAIASIVGGLFDSNTARAAGGAIVTSSSVVFSITGATFTNNGNLNCYEPPLVSALLPPRRTAAACRQAARPPALLPHVCTYLCVDDGCKAGGAINVGFDIFSSESSCAASANPPAPSVVSMVSCVVSSNLASSTGGGISVQDGIFTMQARHSGCIVQCLLGSKRGTQSCHTRWLLHAGVAQQHASHSRLRAKLWHCSCSSAYLHGFA
jgi:predicted outer membrane repeat protein